VVIIPTGAVVPKDVPQEFYDAADRFIDLANDLARSENVSRVSAVIMFAAARYNAHCMLVLDPDVAENVDAATDYFTKQYRSMLAENVERLLKAKPPAGTQGKGADGDGSR
jgi:hypothetical protein